MMFHLSPLLNLEEYFLSIRERGTSKVYSYRISGYHPEMEAFLEKYLLEAQQKGLVLEQRLPNPTPPQLSYYQEMMGTDFLFSLSFLEQSLGKWLPRLSPQQKQIISSAIFSTLEDLQKQGKNLNILKNITIKFFCWMYYRLEPVLRRLGKEEVPKILYQGAVSDYELRLFSVLQKAGCDLVFLQLEGEGNYGSLDPTNLCSMPFLSPSLIPFPSEFSIAYLREKQGKQQKLQRLYQVLGDIPLEIGSNEKIQGTLLEGVLVPPINRQNVSEPSVAVPEAPQVSFATPSLTWTGSNTTGLNLTGSSSGIGQPSGTASPSVVGQGSGMGQASPRNGAVATAYPIFGMILGVEQKSEYPVKLYETYLSLTQSGREVLILHGIPVPTPEEIGKIQKGQYPETHGLLQDLSKKISFPQKPIVEKLMRKAFLDTLLASESFLQEPIHRQVNQCVYLLAWLDRYGQVLFPRWEMGDISCCFYMPGQGVPKIEPLFLRLLSHLPVDVLVLAPSAQEPLWQDGEMVLETYGDTLVMEKFPQENPHIGTVAYHAEREMNSMLEDSSGIYTQHQFAKASTITLKTMYEEIAILWRQETRFRPNFLQQGGEVHMPLLFAKLSGVPEGNVSGYWQGVRELLGEETVIIPQAPWFPTGMSIPFLDVVTGLYQGTQLHRDKIKAHKFYGYGFFREEVQEHILDKIQWMLSQSLLKGMEDMGIRHRFVALGLTLPMDILRMIQTFDFTKVPPKICYIQHSEQMPTREDAMVLALLHALGFDVLLFVPTGYLGVEQYYEKQWMEEHQIGPYHYDLQVPSLTPVKKGWLEQSQTLASKLFRGKK